MALRPGRPENTQRAPKLPCRLGSSRRSNPHADRAAAGECQVAARADLVGCRTEPTRPTRSAPAATWPDLAAAQHSWGFAGRDHPKATLPSERQRPLGILEGFEGLRSQVYFGGLGIVRRLLDVPPKREIGFVSFVRASERARRSCVSA